VSDRPLNVLFLCTGNSARSILAEAILNHLSEGRVRAYSAGSQPKGEPHPLALDELQRAGISTEGLSSKSWTVFAEPGAPQMDFIFTVCDSAAGETCPLWPGRPTTAHWGIEDPAAVQGSDLERRTAFATAARLMRNRISAFLALPLTSLDALAAQQLLREIGQMEGKSHGR